jgi:anti-sigma-K factor RskA
MSLDAPPAPRPFDGARGYSHEQMTWRDIMIAAAIAALLAAAITVAVRIVIENLTF